MAAARRQPTVRASAEPSRLAWCAIALCALVLRAADARAQAAPTPQAVAAASDALRAGVAAAHADQWADALAAFERAYALTPRASLLLNVASAQAHVGQLVAAAETYRRFLREATDPASVPYRDAGARALAQIDARIPRVRITAPGLEATDALRLDGATLSLDALGTALPLEPGRHTLVASRDAVEIGRATFELAEGASERLALDVPPRTPVPTSPHARATGTVTPARSDPRVALTTREHTGHVVRPASPWVAVAITSLAIVLAAGVVATVWVVATRPDSGNLLPGRLDVN